jgi:hypothetical protein
MWARLPTRLKGGTWIARFRDETRRQHYQAIGAADDARDPDGITVFSFAQAQEKARAFFKLKAREAAGDLAPQDGPYTVDQAMEGYLKAYERRGGRAVYHARRAAETHILPAFGITRGSPRNLPLLGRSLGRSRTIAGPTRAQMGFVDVEQQLTGSSAF